MVDEGDDGPFDGVPAREPGLGILAEQVVVEDDHVRLHPATPLREVLRNGEFAEHLDGGLAGFDQPHEPGPNEGLGGRDDYLETACPSTRSGQATGELADAVKL